MNVTFKTPYVVDGNKLIRGFIADYPDGEGIRKYHNATVLGKDKEYGESGLWYFVLKCEDEFRIHIPEGRESEFIEAECLPIVIKKSKWHSCANQVTLPAGYYYAACSVPIAIETRLRLRNLTKGETVKVGMMQSNTMASEFSIAENTVLEVQYWHEIGETTEPVEATIEPTLLYPAP